MEDLGSFIRAQGKPGRPKKSKSPDGPKTKKGKPGSMEETQEKFAEARKAQEAALRDMERDPTLKQMVRDKILNRTFRMEKREKDNRLRDILEAGKERARMIPTMTPVQYTGLNYYRFKDGAEYHLANGITGAQFLRRTWVIVNLAK